MNRKRLKYLLSIKDLVSDKRRLILEILKEIN